MLPHARYEISESIASGDFATVYRGMDHELKRDVAIKQIHEQYLADPRQLDRYWQEAHLLAALQHPHIMTIYDIVRERGWLILELMQGSLTQLLGGRPIDLKDLRLTLNYTLQALQTMHRHGILHGDIKPSNLLVDRNSRVKLGDFGIARRIAGEGSVVKGTTKYMAPEVVSDQFGAVGPASDIYSLGFTAYELMCGEHFESLFPGLNMYGRDRQIAWMMWHSAPDRRLPEVARVLEGVPADLAFIIQKMTEKDPAHRYRTTDECLADLKLDGHVPPVGPTAAELAAAEQQVAAARRRRSVAIAAAACSIVLSLGMLFFLPSGTPPQEGKPAAIQHPAAGEIVTIDRVRGRVFVKPESGEPRAVPIREGIDRIFLNGRQVVLADLDRRDRVQIAESSSAGKRFLVLEATREAAQEAQGLVTAVDASSSLITVRQSQPAQEEVPYLVNAQASIELNGQVAVNNRPLQLIDLRPNDRVMLRYKMREDRRREAAMIRSTRTLTEEAWVVDVKDNELSLRFGASWDAVNSSAWTLTLADDCIVSLNGRSDDGQRPITLADLRPRDKVRIEYDVSVHRVDAFRDMQSDGILDSIDVAAKKISVKRQGGETTEYVVTSSTKIEVAGAQITLHLVSLRPGDQVTVRRQSADPDIREAALITVVPQFDPHAWALILEQADYLNAQVPRLPFVTEDGAALHQALRFHYRVPETQCLRERNLSQSRLQNVTSGFVQRVPQDAQLIVFYLGVGYVDAKGKGYLAANDFDEQRLDQTALPLRWLLDQLESCRADEKLLILCTGQDGGKSPAGTFASPIELAEAARPRRGRPLSNSVALLTCCGPGEAALTIDDQKRTVFGLALASGFSGQADTNHDRRLNGVEIRTFVAAESKRLLGNGARKQTPTLIPPDPTLPRLTDSAREAVARILQSLAQPNPEVPRFEYEDARRLCAGQPDADLGYALVLMKQDKTPPALETIEKLVVEHPDACVAYQSAAWIYGRRGDLSQSINQLGQLVRNLPQPRNDSDKAFEQHALSFAGQVAYYALSVAPQSRRVSRNDLAELEQAVKQRGPETYAVFIAGGRAIKRKVEELDGQIQEAASDSDKSRLELQRSNFNYHVPFDFESVRQYLLARLDD